MGLIGDEERFLPCIADTDGHLAERVPSSGKEIDTVDQAIFVAPDQPISPSFEHRLRTVDKGPFDVVQTRCDGRPHAPALVTDARAQDPVAVCCCSRSRTVPVGRASHARGVEMAADSAQG